MLATCRSELRNWECPGCKMRDRSVSISHVSWKLKAQQSETGLSINQANPDPNPIFVGSCCVPWQTSYPSFPYNPSLQSSVLLWWHQRPTETESSERKVNDGLSLEENAKISWMCVYYFTFCLPCMRSSCCTPMSLFFISSLLMGMRWYPVGYNLHFANDNADHVAIYLLAFRIFSVKRLCKAFGSQPSQELSGHNLKPGPEPGGHPGSKEREPLKAGRGQF